MDTMKSKYRCRLCKQEYRDGVAGGRKIAEKEMYLLVTGNKPTEPLAPSMTTLHYCKNGGLGLADFIGWEVDNE